MKIRAELELSLTLLHKQTMQKLQLHRKICNEWDENSEEYQALCRQFEKEVGFAGTYDKDGFDKRIIQIASEEAKKSLKETVENIEHVFRTCFSENVNGYVEFAGYIINPSDFCAVQVEEIRSRFQKV